MNNQENDNGSPPMSSRAKLAQSDKHARILLEVTNSLAVSKNLDDALAILVKITTHHIKAERGTVFINDQTTGELYSRIAQGNLKREIRILNTKGVAGWVFSNNQGAIITDAYKDPRFNKAVDVRTGFRTKSILCAPLRTMTGDVIGVTQLLNKADGTFDQDDLELLEAMTEQAAIVIQGNVMVEQVEASRQQELEFLDVVSQVSSELELGPLLEKIIRTISHMLDSERATLFINDEKTNMLYTEVGEGLGKNIIKFPNNVGIAGTVFQTGKPLNIPHAYADLRFNPSFDRSSGFFTRSILCMPVISKDGKCIGVSQVLNKRGGPFTKEDEKRLAAFTSQISMGIENAKLFDEVQNAMNYTQSMLASMNDGVVTFDTDQRVKTINPAGLRILQFDREEFIIKKHIDDLFIDDNVWMKEALTDVKEPKEYLDAELIISGKKTSVNLNILPLVGERETPKGKEKYELGSMMMFADISSEKRMKSTMSRYMDPGLAEQLMASGGEGDIMGGKQSVASVLFSDVRSFTTITEELGAQGTVKLLNEYFEIMVECITDEGGMLDKFIGDAMMCIFGTPVPHDDDPDRAVRAAIQMMVKLNELNAQRAKDGKMPIDHGMGVNTDNVVSGNIGSPKRMDYTVIGDGVNLAARIESACKQYGAHILISEFTQKACKATYRTREVDLVIVKGKTEPVSVFEVLDYHDDDSFPNLVEGIQTFNDGIRCFRKAEWDKGMKLFQNCLKLNPKDKAAQLYIDRTEHLKANPPEGEWDGVWVMTTK